MDKHKLFLNDTPCRVGICAEKIKKEKEEGEGRPKCPDSGFGGGGLGTNHPSELGKFQHLDLELKAEV